MTQTDRVLELLRERGPQGLTALDALRLAGTMRLAARISDARLMLRAGEVIDSERVVINGKTVARYVLRTKTKPFLSIRPFRVRGREGLLF